MLNEEQVLIKEQISGMCKELWEQYFALEDQQTSAGKLRDSKILKQKEEILLEIRDAAVAIFPDIMKSLKLKPFDSFHGGEAYIAYRDVASFLAHPEYCGLVTNMQSLFHLPNERVIERDKSGQYDDRIAIENVIFKEYDTSHVTNMKQLFRGQTLEFVDFRGMDTARVSDMSGMFECAKVENIIGLSTLNTSSLISAHAMFYSFASSKLDLKGFDLRYAKDVNSFLSSVQANEVDVTGLQFDNTTELESFFGGIRGRTEENTKLVGLETWNTSHIQSFSSMFSGIHVQELDISTLDTSSGKLFCNMFSYIQNGKVIKGINTLNLGNACDFSYMFYRFLNTDPSSGIIKLKFNCKDKRKLEMNGMFADASLLEVDMNEFYTNDAWYDAKQMFAGSDIERIYMQNLHVRNPELCEQMFSRCRVKYLMIDDSLKDLGMALFVDHFEKMVECNYEDEYYVLPPEYL